MTRDEMARENDDTQFESVAPPVFVPAAEIVAHRRDLTITVDGVAWLRDVRDTDEWLDDDPFHSRH